jgi:hypothetical protein
LSFFPKNMVSHIVSRHKSNIYCQLSDMALITARILKNSVSYEKIISKAVTQAKLSVWHTWDTSVWLRELWLIFLKALGK